MKLLLDIAVAKEDAFIPSLLNNTFLHSIADSGKEFEWWLVADENRVKELVQRNINVIPSPPTTKTHLFNRLLAKSALRSTVKKLNPQLVLSAAIVHKGAVNCYLLQSHKQFKKLKTSQLRTYQYLFATSFELKQVLIHHSLFPSERIYVTRVDSENDFMPLHMEEQQSVRNNWTSGYQYFFVNNEDLSVKQLMPLLKAFSLFKKRLQTGMKLMINSSSKFEDELVSLLSTYKYKEDVLLTNQTAHQMLNALTASAYAAIQFAQNDSVVLPQQMIAVKTPVMMLQPQSFQEQEGLFIYADENNADDIVWKMMLLYKDEMYRNKIIENAQQSASVYFSNTLLSFIQELPAGSIQQNQS